MALNDDIVTFYTQQNCTTEFQLINVAMCCEPSRIDCEYQELNLEVMENHGDSFGKPKFILSLLTNCVSRSQTRIWKSTLKLVCRSHSMLIVVYYYTKADTDLILCSLWFTIIPKQIQYDLLQHVA